MPRIRQPRSGSMQFWPRKRAKRLYARVKAWANTGTKLMGFAGYKVGMTHLMGIDAYKHSQTKGEEISIPATIIECPPLKIAFICFYKNNKILTKILSSSIDKELGRKIPIPKKPRKVEDVKDFTDVTAVCYTQPKQTGIGKKKPELFEVHLGGKPEEKLAYLKERLGKEIPVTEIFKEGELVDFHVITKGKGTKGPVQRFGIGLKASKSEKSRRMPGARSGGWTSQGHMMHRVAQAGQLGYQQRTEYNKLILKIGTKPDEVNKNGGFHKYGNIKNQYVIVKGSVGGARKRRRASRLGSWWS